jgi:hypothetical protein
MQQFDTQFIDRYMQPLLMRIFTDIAAGKENTYLQKLLAGTEIIPFREEEKKDFINDYFLTDKTKPFSTTSQEDQEFQNAFIGAFSDLIRNRSRLSGVDGTRQAFFPDKEKRFDEISVRNIYDLSYKITLTFEKNRVGQLIAAKIEKGEITDAKASHDQALLAGGRLKLVNVNGTDQYISEEEARASAGTAAGQVTAIPLIAVGTSGRPSDIALTSQKGKTAAEVAAMSAAAGPLSTQPKTATIAEVAGDFKPPKKASMEMMMEKNGLEVTGEGFTIDDHGTARGKVKDANGQLLFVEAETIPVENDPQKYEFQFKFTFADDTSKSFKLNQTDLNRFQPSEKERKSAQEVGFGVKPKPFTEKKPRGTLTAEAEIGAASVEAILSRSKANAEKTGQGGAGNEEAYNLPGKATEGISKTEKGKEKMEIPQPVRMPISVKSFIKAQTKTPSTIMEQKKRLAAKPQIPGQLPKYNPIPGGPNLAYGQQPAAPTRKKNRMPLLAGLATGGTIFAGLGVTTIAGMNTGTGNPDLSAVPTLLAGAVNVILKLTHFFT